MHFLFEIILVVVAIAFAGGVLRASSPRVTKDGRVTLHYLLALVAWVPVWFFTHFVWYFVQDHLLGHHHTAIGYPWWFWLILLIGAAAAFVPGSGRVVQVIGAVLVVIALFCVNWFGPVAGDSHKDASAPSAHPTPTVTVTATPLALPYHQRKASQCDAGFNVVFDKNAEKNLVSGGIPRNKFPTAQAAVKKLVGVMNHDSRVLYVYYTNSPEQKLSPISREAQLRGTGLNDGCYSAKGQQVFNAMVVELAHAKIKNVQAPAVGVNTGANPGGMAFQVPVGRITGNRDAVKIVYENGTTVHMLRRCGNLEVPRAIPNLPVQHVPTPAPTQHAPRPTATHPQPTPTPTPTPTHAPPPKTCYSVYGPGYNGTYPNCVKAAVNNNGSTYVPPPPASAPGPNPAPVPVVITPTNGGAPSTQATSAQCYYESDGSPAIGYTSPVPGYVRCS